MTLFTFVARSLRFYWRNHLATVLGATLAASILTGALAVGDSVRYSLERLALLRLGKTELAVASPAHFFRAALADDLEQGVSVRVSPVLSLRGVVTVPDGHVRVNKVQILGVDERFWSLGENGSYPRHLAEGQGLMNRHLASRLDWKEGQAIVLRLEKPSWLPRDAPLSSDKDISVGTRMGVAGVVRDEQMGRFSLEANQVATPTVFVPLSSLQKLIEKPGRVNALLIAQGPTAIQASEALRKAWTLDDADLVLRGSELRTRRVFIDPGIAGAVQRALPQARGVLSYFVNELRHQGRATPYSLVTAMQGGVVPEDMKDGEILINSWLAEDLQAKPGDTIQLSYFVAGPGRKLEERTNSFRVRAIVPLEGAAADRELMPEFPGLHDSENCRDWDAGIPIDFKKIRDKDEKYWEEYRGTPKAFLTLRAGQQIWNNRFGNLTALRFPLQEGLDTKIRDAIDPASVGLFVQPVREQALAAARQSMDFGQLFLGFSLFLIIAALVLTGLLFSFGVEQRSQEIGTLLALGFTPQRVRRLFLHEGLAVASSGALLGLIGGIAYTKAALWGLTTVWRDAVSGTELQYRAEPITLLIGVSASVLMAGLVIWLTARRQAKLPARVLLAMGSGTYDASGTTPSRRLGWIIGAVCGIAGVTVLLMSRRDQAAAAAFFIAGALLLSSGLAFCHTLLAGLSARSSAKRPRLAALGFRNCTRRRGRSLATICLLACGCFLVVAVAAYRHAPVSAKEHSPGAGGFDWYAETTIGLHQDLNLAEVREELGLSSAELAQMKVVPLRLHDGDDASCLNLNRAQTPRLLGVHPQQFAERAAFAFLQPRGLRRHANPWLMLDQKQPDGAVPAIADQNTIVWALGKSVGDLIPYTDERGRPFQVRIVGMIANSILQGSLIISESQFIDRFPSESGYRVLLIDDAHIDTAAWSRAFRDKGLELTRTSQRLDEFNAVENTYLSIFQALGGLGILLGSAGLGIVVLRNVLERRSELAILRAVGFRRRSVQWLVLTEHWWLLLLGLGCGTITGFVAVMPSLDSFGSGAFLIGLLLAILVSGILWIWLATIAALRGPLLNALRNE